jgi:hypothetical protein
VTNRKNKARRTMLSCEKCVLMDKVLLGSGVWIASSLVESELWMLLLLRPRI